MVPSRADAPIQDEDGGGNNQAGNDGWEGMDLKRRIAGKGYPLFQDDVRLAGATFSL